MSQVGFIASYTLEINNNTIETDLYIKYTDLGIDDLNELIKKYV